MRVDITGQWAIAPEHIQGFTGVLEAVESVPEGLLQEAGRPFGGATRMQLRDGAAIIPVRGLIVRYHDWLLELLGASSVQNLSLDLRAALDSDAVERIVLEVDSPGGMIAGVSELAEMVRRAEKPVTAYVSALGASAAYWIASAAHQVIANDIATLGGVGIAATVLVRRQSDTLEIVSSQSPHKRPDPSKTEGRVQLQRQIDAVAQVFVDHVALYRNVSAQTVLTQFGGGGLLVGAEAVRAGLADGLGTLEGIIAGAPGKPAPATSTSRELATERTSMMTTEEIEKTVRGMDGIDTERLVAAEWQQNSALRAEFGEEDTAVSYFKAYAAGRVRVCGRLDRGE